MTDLPSLDLGGIDDAESPGRSRLVLAFWAAVALSIVLPRVPYGRNVLYPFSLLGTWAHEMGHGIVAILVGGNFEKLELYSNLGGVAWNSGVGKVGGTLVSAGGLLGPAIFGGLIIVFGARAKTAPWVLAVLSVLIVASVLFVVRNLFGAVSMSLIAVVLVPIAFKAPEILRTFVAQLIGIQFCLASWNTLDYMFTKNFRRNGQTIDSDTQNIADVLLLPYWFWGGLIAGLSGLILVFSFYVAWVRPLRE